MKTRTRKTTHPRSNVPRARPRASTEAASFDEAGHPRRRTQDARLDHEWLRRVREAHAARTAHRVEGNQARAALVGTQCRKRDGGREAAHRSRLAEERARRRTRRTRPRLDHDATRERP